MKFRLVAKDPASLEREMERLSWIPARFTDGEMRDIGAVISGGFARNFEREGTAEIPWRSLAPRTRVEREELQKSGAATVSGFGPEHPILQRSGEYMRSWTNPDHTHHHHQHGSFAGMVVIVEGSNDPRVPVLSGGDWYTNVPARPAEYLDEDSIGNIDTMICALINAHI